MKTRWIRKMMAVTHEDAKRYREAAVRARLTRDHVSANDFERRVEYLTWRAGELDAYHKGLRSTLPTLREWEAGPGQKRGGQLTLF